MEHYGDQAVVWQTAINPVIAMELIHEGTWRPEGVNGPEWFPAKPYLDKLEEYGTGWGLREEDASDITRELTA
jgi:saccharopine dehydrogenase-like NADP-dependent oxidoreductase